MKVALAQLKGFLGDFNSNQKKVLENIKLAKKKQVDFLILPEATIFGYPPTDFILWKNLIEKQLKEVKKLEQKIPSSMAVLLGVF